MSKTRISKTKHLKKHLVTSIKIFWKYLKTRVQE